jgi:hypothetical protein
MKPPSPKVKETPTNQIGPSCQHSAYRKTRGSPTDRYLLDRYTARRSGEIVTPERTGILKVRVSPPTPATSSSVETKSGRVRWALLEGTLLIQPEQEAVLDDPAQIEHLVRTVMQRCGLARRYHVFAIGAELR